MPGWSLDPSVTAGSLGLAGGYLSAIGPWRRRFVGSAPVARWQVAAFLAGSLTLFLALGTPLDTLSDQFLLSAHMVQHFLLTMVMPPLLLVGTPAWLVRPLLRSRVVGPLLRWATSPVTAFVAFNLILAFSHFPSLYNRALEDHRLHVMQHLLYMGSAMLVWWPLFSPLPELPRLPHPLRLLFLFALTVPGSLVGSMIVYASEPLYQVYGQAARIVPLSALDDQRLGGLMMWLGVPAYIFTFMTVIFFAWASAEERRSRVELASRQRIRPSMMQEGEA